MLQNQQQKFAQALKIKQFFKHDRYDGHQFPQNLRTNGSEN